MTPQIFDYISRKLQDCTFLEIRAVAYLTLERIDGDEAVFSYAYPLGQTDEEPATIRMKVHESLRLRPSED